ncbi:hypothetical protein DTW90_22740 [Neorhizobium sp. P12A]|uniref:hypothetical protein n=1 Tax=Neorhizobium sp. P12A TaxID=2268027 RepID=UPI0011EEAEE1|nr:hypothetical protein [Neorhizobium sp. P12A]KAA0695392.1 hypothetical protein DTW90_22740 [Neorhizobium sp. P12A]
MKSHLYSRTLHHAEQDHVSDRLVLASRYADCLRHLAVTATRLGLADLAEAIADLSRAIDRMAYDLAVSDYGIVVLGRAGRLIGTVERRLAKKSREAILH